MKTKLLAILLLCAATIAQATTTISFYGVVDASTKFRVGEPFSVTVIFNPNNGLIQRYDLSVGLDFNLSGTKNGGYVAYDNNPTHGSVYYQIIESEFMDVTMQAPTPDGVLPACVTDFALNDFILNNNPLLGTTSGHLTSLPVIR